MPDSWKSLFFSVNTTGFLEGRKARHIVKVVIFLLLMDVSIRFLPMLRLLCSPPGILVLIIEGVQVSVLIQIFFSFTASVCCFGTFQGNFCLVLSGFLCIWEVIVCFENLWWFYILLLGIFLILSCPLKSTQE